MAGFGNVHFHRPLISIEETAATAYVTAAAWGAVADAVGIGDANLAPRSRVRRRGLLRLRRSSRSDRARRRR